MRPSRTVPLLLIAATAAGACSRQPAMTYAQPQVQPGYMATHRPSVDGLMWGPVGGYVYYNPARQQQAYVAATAPQAQAPAPPPQYSEPISAAQSPLQDYAGPPDYSPSPYQPAGQAVGGVYQQAAYPQPGLGEGPYTLDSGDRVRVVVYGQGGINGSYTVDPSGLITLPLGGAIRARGLTKDQLAQAIIDRLKQGYIRAPHVAVEIEGYRPFFILGEVTTPGQYPFVANMTVETAVAIAGGFKPRADRNKITITRSVNGQVYKGALPPNSMLRPGDTIEIAERWF